MDTQKSSIPVFLLVSALSLVALAGCSSNGSQDGATNVGGAATSADTTKTTMSLETVKQWAGSGHAQVVTRAATEDGCKNCHDGLTFSETGGGFQARMTMPAIDTSAQADASDPGTDDGDQESVRDFAVATDCRACHTGAGAAIADRGTVDQIPSITSAEGGLGAVCMACHNGWHMAGKNADGELTAPHTSVQTDMLYGVNTVDPGVESTATQGDMRSPHLKVKNTCVGCHLAGDDGSNHTFRVTSFAGCEAKDCHDTDMSQGAIAKEDYDGDGTKEETVVEIEGLSAALETAIESKAGKFESQRGQVVFVDGAKPDQATYAAAYNYFFVQKDGSRGVHNTSFVVDLLTRSIRAVGGETGSGATDTATPTP